MVRRFSDITPWGGRRQTTPPWFLTRSLPLALFHTVTLPLIICSPPPPHTIRTFSLSCILPLHLSSLHYSTLFVFFFIFCERASLIKAEPPFFSSLPWERRSFWEMKRLSREKCSQLSNSWTKAHLNDDKCHCLICSFGAFSGTLSTKIFKEWSTAVYFYHAYFTCKKLWSLGGKKTEKKKEKKDTMRQIHNNDRRDAALPSSKVLQQGTLFKALL